MPASGLPFDDIRSLIANMPGPDMGAANAVRARDKDLTKPAGSLGRMEEIAEWLAAWQGKAPPRVDRPLVCVFAGNHGVVAQGVSAYPQAVTRQMLENFAAGGAAINQICAAFDLGFKVFDLALDLPTGDFTQGDALDEKACVATMAFGMEALAGGADLLCLGEMGIGNTTAAAALAAALFDGKGADWVGRGTGVDDAGLLRKAAVVDAAVAFHGAKLADPLAALACVGGRELAAIFGATLAARHYRIPVLLDGFVCTAAAAPLAKLQPGGLAHAVASHVSAEAGHRDLLAKLGLKPLLDFNMRLGEASGACLAVSLLRFALACHSGMASFAEAGVSER